MPSREATLYLLAACFAVGHLTLAGLFQSRFEQLPQASSSIVDHFNAVLLWATSIACLLVASEQTRRWWRFLFWCALALGFAALGIDETLEFHERTGEAIGDDDYVKALAWTGSALLIAAIVAVERPRAGIVRLLSGALFSSTLWILCDLGDGDWFRIPVTESQLLWFEEYLEMATSHCFLWAVAFHYRELLTEGATAVPRSQSSGLQVRLRRAAVWAAVAGVLIAVAGLINVTLIGPRVYVRWRADVAASDREALERRFDLRGGEPDRNSPGTWQYELRNRSRENVAALLADPAVEDTHNIDRETLTVPWSEIRFTWRGPLARGP